MPPYLSKAAVLDDLACLKAQKNIMTLHALKGAEKYTKTVSKSHLLVYARDYYIGK